MSAQPLEPKVIAEIADSEPGPEFGAFFDLDGTLVDGFTATAHASDRIRRRQAKIGEVLGVVEASMRYRLGRMRFEHLLTRAAGYLRGDSLAKYRRSVRQRERTGGQCALRMEAIGQIALCLHRSRPLQQYTRRFRIWTRQ